MRKVNPEDEIPKTALHFDNIIARESTMRDKVLDADVVSELNELRRYIESFSGGLVDTEQMLKRVYQVADLYMERMVYPYSVCTKGCAYCCTRIKVEATCFEADYIHKHTGHLELNLKTKARYASNKKVKGACPFLDKSTGKCSGYEYRPLQCRLFTSIDSYTFCKNPSTEHLVHSPKSHVLWDWLIGVFAQLAYQAHMSQKVTPLADMREWFKEKK